MDPKQDGIPAGLQVVVLLVLAVGGIMGLPIMILPKIPVITFQAVQILDGCPIEKCRKKRG